MIVCSLGIPAPNHYSPNSDILRSVTPKHINVTRRVTQTEFWQKESHTNQLRNPDSSSNRKPEMATYFKTLTFAEERRLAKEARLVCEEMPVRKEVPVVSRMVTHADKINREAQSRASSRASRVCEPSTD